MSDRKFGDDPFAGEGLEPIAIPKGAKGKAVPAAMVPGEPDEGASVDQVLACQPFNDDGNAQRFVLRFGDDFMFIRNIGWHYWDGARWNGETGPDEAFKAGFQVARVIEDEATALDEHPGKLAGAALRERVGRLYAWAVQSGNLARVAAMLATAARHLTRDVEELDTEPFLLAAPNGTIRLGTHCDLLPSNRANLITHSINVPYTVGAECPRFERFLERIIPDEDLRDFLQRICGYMLTGSTREHKLFLFYGTGRNGKSTLVNVLRKVMGDYAMGSPVTTFLAKRDGGSGGEPSPDLARLPGARMVTAAEPPEGARLDESRVKEMTGGDAMTVRHLNQGFFEFQPVFKAIISTNHLPTIRGTDCGIWARINIVPFQVQIPEVEIDRDLEGKLLEEAPGILQWMLTGAEDWFNGGLRPPEKAVAAVMRYRADEDPVGEFLKSCAVLTGDQADPMTRRPFEVNAKDLRDRYRVWCEGEGLDPLSAKVFGMKLTARGIEKRRSNGNTTYIGLMLKLAY